MEFMTEKVSYDGIFSSMLKNEYGLAHSDILGILNSWNLATDFLMLLPEVVYFSENLPKIPNFFVFYLLRNGVDLRFFGT